jgi:hypothetical protein
VQLDAYLNTNCTDYVRANKLRKNGTWATDAEIMATANLLQMDVSVWTMFGKKLKWLKYPASFNLNIPSHHTLLLVNENNQHFNAVTSTM